MATTSQVKKGLDNISNLIDNNRSKLTRVKSEVAGIYNSLAGIPTQYSDIVQSINVYVPNGSFEVLCKDELSKLQSEFVALRNAANALVQYLDTESEF